MLTNPRVNSQSSTYANSQQNFITWPPSPLETPSSLDFAAPLLLFVFPSFWVSFLASLLLPSHLPPVRALSSHLFFSSSAVTSQVTLFYLMALNSIWILNNDEFQICIWNNVLFWYLLSLKLIYPTAYSMSLPGYLSICPVWSRTPAFPPQMSFILFFPFLARTTKQVSFPEVVVYFFSCISPPPASSDSKAYL